MNEVAVVSGATGGIGSTVARALWQAGYSILGLGRNGAALEDMQQWCVEHPLPGQHAQTLVYDVLESADQDTLRYILHTMAEAPTVLAVCHGHPPVQIDGSDPSAEAAVRRVFDTDVIGTLRLCQLVAAAMRSGGGSITILSSAHAKATYPDRVPYSITKSAIGGLVRGLAVDWGRDGIRVNAVCCWQTEGPRTVQVASREGDDTLERYLAKSPLRRLVDPQDVAQTVLWLARCRSVSGAEILVDCAVSASLWHRPYASGK